MLHHVEAAALGIRREVIERPADHHLALVALAPVRPQRRRQRHRVEHGLHGLAHHGLQRIARHRQVEPRHPRQHRRMPRHGQCHLLGANAPARRVHAHHALALLQEARHRAVLDDVHAQCRSTTRVAPGHGVVACGPAAALDEAPQDGKARVGAEVQARLQGLQLTRIQQVGVDAVAAHGVGPAALGVQVVARMRERQHAARTQHDVVVELLRQAFVQLQRKVVQPRALGVQVVGAHDRGVAPGVPAANPPSLHHSDVGDAVVLGQVVRRGQAMAATAHHHHVIGRPGLGLTPGRGPVGVPTPCSGQQVPGGVAGSHSRYSHEAI